MSREYKLEEMLECLEGYFENKGYKVTQYSDDFESVRVPLYCRREEEITWSKVPGDDDKRLQDYLIKYTDCDWINTATFRKTNDKEITIDGNKKSAKIIITEEDKVTFITDNGRYNLTKRRDREKDELYISYIDEIVIEITTDTLITKKKFFPLLTDGEPPNEITIIEASPVRFLQYCFPTARVYYAIPDYVNKDDEFNEFKKVCNKRHIGLLETPQKEIGRDRKIREIIKPISLSDQICELVIEHKLSEEGIRGEIEKHLEDSLHYLVSYAVPTYRRRAIIRKKPGKISGFLIDRLQDLEHIRYKATLEKLASNYRDGILDDYDTVLLYTNILWKERLGLEYPLIHRNMEEVLLRDEMYRDHFVHQFQVFLIGAYIIEKMYKTRGFVEILESFNKEHKCKIEDAWLAASTYHDFSYGLQNFDNWLLRYFSDTLSIKNEEAKEKLNILNLDAAMVRESLSEILMKIEKLLNLNEMQERKARKFLYEKTTRDRNHGVLSALSVIELYENQEDNSIIKENAILQAALAILCHDEDIWEALCGCKGFLSSDKSCPGGNCRRGLSLNKKVAVHRSNITTDNNCQRLCEIWEQELMQEQIFGKISFDEHPLIFLLIFCDTIQEEGRITSTFSNDGPSFRNHPREMRVDASMLSNWSKSGEELETFEERGEIKSIFATINIVISDKARIYQLDRPADRRWKILDKGVVYHIEVKRGKKVIFQVKPSMKECSLKRINVSFGKLEVDLIIDGLMEKSEELRRVSWCLKDKRFKVNLREKDTEEYKEMEINGRGGE